MASDDVCTVSGCGQKAARSIPTKKVKDALPDLNLLAERRRSHLCRDHYRQFRKKTKKERQWDRLAW